MNRTLGIRSAVVLFALLAAACSTLPERNSALEDARTSYYAARSDPRVEQLAPVEFMRAARTFDEAELAWRNDERPSRVDHLAYLAKQQSLIAIEAARARTNQAALDSAAAERDRARLEARTREAERRAEEARIAQVQADASRQQAMAAQQQASAAQQQAQAALQQAESQRQQAEAARQQAAAEADRNRNLQVYIQELQAKPTDRGLVVTINDVLFDTGRAELKPGGVRMLQKMAEFLRQYPERTVMVEGFTDSVGGETYNLSLSERRADAVRATLVGMGVSPERIHAQAYGKAFPIASNASPAGRQLNRRVEVVISNETGRIPPRAG